MRVRLITTYLIVTLKLVYLLVMLLTMYLKIKILFSIRRSLWIRKFKKWLKKAKMPSDLADQLLQDYVLRINSMLNVKEFYKLIRSITRH